VAKKQPSTDKKAKPAAKSAAKPAAEKAALKSAAKPAKSLFSEPADEPKPAKPAAKKSAATVAPARPLTVEEIGHAAGEVWGALSTGNGGVSLAALKKSVDAPADLVLLALGWLAREGKVEIDSSNRTLTISLK